MTPDEFSATLSNLTPPIDIDPVLQGLWYDANHNWEAAHNIAQSREGTQPYDRFHAYLHRKEGDRFNANYWYRRAKEPFFEGSLEDEWNALVRQMLNA